MSLIKRDIRTSKRSILIKFGTFFTIFIAYVLLVIHYRYNYEIINANTLIFEIFKGCKYVESSTGLSISGFKFPVIWLFINSFIIYAVGNYFYKDIKINGKYVLIRVKKMQYIYIAKIIWSIVMIIAYYVILLLVSAMLGYLFRTDIYKYIDPNYLKIDTIDLIKNIFVLYTLTSISLVVIFITLTLKIKPEYAFLINIVLCASSIFVENKFFIGQHSLLIRHTPFDLVHNFTMYDSIIYNLIITTCVIAIGSALASKKEIF